jgi:tetratricopeptide (TPR) repeat protein
MLKAPPAIQLPELATHTRLFGLNKEIVVAVVTLATMMTLFLTDHWLVGAYQSREVALAQKFYDAGSRQLTAGEPDAAVASFRTALLYSRDDVRYRLRLAEALISSGRYNEARSHLDTLLEEAPGNAAVNLDLARVSVKQGARNAALRFFHSAIYGQWGENPVERRRNTRFELINFLLQNNQSAQAQSELMGLAAELPNDPSLLIETAVLFERVQDYTPALELYRRALEVAPGNPVAAAGAGIAAFHVENYVLAARFLRRAVAERPKDEQSKSLLTLTSAVLTLDPYQRGLTQAEKSARVITAFRLAGQRLDKCAASLPNTGFDTAADLSSQWSHLRGTITPHSLSRDPELSDKAMNLAFQIEKQLSSVCVAAAEDDQALLLLAGKHGESER